MNNGLATLQDKLFASLDALTKASDKNIGDEIKKAEAICGISTQIINAQALNLKALSMTRDFGDRVFSCGTPQIENKTQLTPNYYKSCK